MRVEIEVDLRPAPPGPAAEAKPTVDPAARAEQRRRDREERMLRRLALAQVIEASITIGRFNDMADLAQLCGVSRARVSQVIARADSQ